MDDSFKCKYCDTHFMFGKVIPENRNLIHRGPNDTYLCFPCHDEYNAMKSLEGIAFGVSSLRGNIFNKIRYTTNDEMGE